MNTVDAMVERRMVKRWASTSRVTTKGESVGATLSWMYRQESRSALGFYWRWSAPIGLVAAGILAFGWRLAFSDNPPTTSTWVIFALTVLVAAAVAAGSALVDRRLNVHSARLTADPTLTEMDARIAAQVLPKWTATV